MTVKKHVIQPLNRRRNGGFKESALITRSKGPWLLCNVVEKEILLVSHINPQTGARKLSRRPEEVQSDARRVYTACVMV